MATITNANANANSNNNNNQRRNRQTATTNVNLATIYTFSPKELEKRFFVRFGAFFGRVVVILVGIMEIMYTMMDSKLFPSVFFGFSLLIMLNIVLLIGSIFNSRKCFLLWIFYYTYSMIYAIFVLAVDHKTCWIPAIHYSSVARQMNVQSYGSQSKFVHALLLTTGFHYMIVALTLMAMDRLEEDKNTPANRLPIAVTTTATNTGRSTSRSNNNSSSSSSTRQPLNPPSYREATTTASPTATATTIETV